MSEISKSDDLRKPEPVSVAKPESGVLELEQRSSLTDRSPVQRKGMPLHRRILIGLIAGISLGIGANASLGAGHPLIAWTVTHVSEPVGTLFLRLLLLFVVPLVFSSLIVGVAGVGDIRKLGRIGLKAFGYTLVISAISVVIGLTLANAVKPGKRIAPQTATQLKQQYGSEARSRVEGDAAPGEGRDSALTQLVKTLVPSNASISGETPNMLHLMFFALMIGVATTFLPRAAAPFVQVMNSLFEISLKIIDLIMLLAPYAVACLLFTNVARFGLDLLGALFWYMFTVLVGLAVHMFVIYSLSVHFLSRIPPMQFFRRIRTVILTAFSTSSSNATLPTALRVSEQNLGVPQGINNFVLTVGATANQNGSALYEGVTVLFLAQLAGVDLSLSQQLLVLYLAILGSIGTAGVPSGSIPFVVAVLATIGVEPSLIAVILGVDRILDMCRTTLNVVGDITAATYVARSEGYQLLTDPPR
jgi:DAACS family dicarboxylate/amino acid:cation (Na+ or H+) symporter